MVRRFGYAQVASAAEFGVPALGNNAPVLPGYGSRAASLSGAPRHFRHRLAGLSLDNFGLIVS